MDNPFPYLPINFLWDAAETGDDPKIMPEAEEFLREMINILGYAAERGVEII